MIREQRSLLVRNSDENDPQASRVSCKDMAIPVVGTTVRTQFANGVQKSKGCHPGYSTVYHDKYVGRRQFTLSYRRLHSVYT